MGAHWLNASLVAALLHSACRIAPEGWCSVVAVPSSEGLWTNETSRESDQGWEVGKGLVIASDKEWMKELGRFNLEKMRPQAFEGL